VQKVQATRTDLIYHQRDTIKIQPQ